MAKASNLNMRDFITDYNGVPVAFCREIIQSGNVSLKAIGLYFSILYGAKDMDFEDPEYGEALKELWSKNFLDYTLRQG